MSNVLTKSQGAPKKVIIKYIVEADGVAVFQEVHDVDHVERLLATEEASGLWPDWGRRIKCVICCRKKSGFVACLARCLVDGKCCDGGHNNCKDA